MSDVLYPPRLTAALELRWKTARGMRREELSGAAWALWCGVEDRNWRASRDRGAYADVASEAIEAAEACAL